MEPPDTAEPSYRTLTVHGAGVALAMLRGQKRCDLRVSKEYSAGWYNLHVGAGAVDSQIQDAHDSWWSTVSPPPTGHAAKVA